MPQTNKNAIPFKDDTFAQYLEKDKNAAIIHLKDAGVVFSTAGVPSTRRNSFKIKFN